MGAQDDHSGGEVPPRFNAVFNNDDRGPRDISQILNGLTHLPHTSGTKIGRGLIEKDETRLHCEHTGQGEPLLLTA